MVDEPKLPTWRNRGRHSIALGERDPRARRASQAEVRGDDFEEPLRFDNRGRVTISLADGGALELAEGDLVVKANGDQFQMTDDGLALRGKKLAGEGVQWTGESFELVKVDKVSEISDPSATTAEAVANRLNKLIQEMTDAKHMDS